MGHRDRMPPVSRIDAAPARSAASDRPAAKEERARSAPTLHILGRIAVTYGVSADELVFDDGKGVAGTKLGPELLSRFEKVAQLPEDEKNAVLLLLDSVIAKHTIRKVMGS